MAITRQLIGGQLVAFDDETGEVYVKSPDMLEALQQIAAILQGSGATIEISGELSDLLGSPAKTLSDIWSRLSSPAQSSDVAAVAAAITGTGLPIPLPLADAGNNEWSAPLEPNPITRACTRLFYIVGASGFQLSFDGGQTVHLTRPEDTADDIAIAIPQGSDVRIRRLTAGTAIDGLIVEVR
jgi:hypothetical protein